MPKLDEARFPAHAIAEIEAAKGKDKAALLQWWESWASIGDAKRAERKAFQAVVDAQLAFAECRAKLRANHPGKSLPPEACDCGKHFRPAVKAQQEREKALTAIDRAVTKHKAGG